MVGYLYYFLSRIIAADCLFKRLLDSSIDYLWVFPKYSKLLLYLCVLTCCCVCCYYDVVIMVFIVPSDMH